MIDTTKMPASFGLCLAQENECPMAGKCLRSLVMRQMQEGEKQKKFVNVVNPGNKEINYRTDACAAFCSCQKVRFARGMKHLFDCVRTSELQAVRNKVMGCFSCDSYFYRSQNGSRLISAEEQQRIARVFKDMNIGEEPVFDSYIDDYDWKQ